MSRIEVGPQESYRFMHEIDRLRTIPAPVPEAEASQAAAAALEEALAKHAEAVQAVRAVEDAEAETARKIHKEAQDAVSAGREPRKLKTADFARARLEAEAHRDAVLQLVRTRRRELDAQMGVDAAEQAAKNAARVPGLHAEALGAVQAAREAFERLLEARESAIEQLAGNPDVVVRPLPWHGPVLEALDAAQAWIEKNAQPFLEPFVEVAGVEPSLAVRRQMAQMNQLEELYAIELREGFQISQWTRGYTPALIPSYHR